jgi:hypothetical protein
MFYRNNLTLSASSNRLNLGTRSFAQFAYVNPGGNPSRNLRTHHDSMRDRMSWYLDIPIIISEVPVPSSSRLLSQVVPGSPGQPSGRPGERGGVVPVSRLISLDLESGSSLLTPSCARLSQASSAGRSGTGSISSSKSTPDRKSKPAPATAYGAAWRATHAASLEAFAAQ